MPRFDGTGPNGTGPMTGRGMGPCAMPAGRQGRGMGWGRGCGRGMGRGRFYSPKNELAALEDEEKMLESELEAIREEKRALSEDK